MFSASAEAPPFMGGGGGSLTMKQYTSPITLLVRLHTESLMQATISPGYNPTTGDNTGNDGDNAETRRQGSDSSIWDSWSN